MPVYIVKTYVLVKESADLESAVFRIYELNLIIIVIKIKLSDSSSLIILF